MKINLSYILSAILAVALVAAIFSFFEISGEKARLRNELMNRSALIAGELGNLPALDSGLADVASQLRFSDSLRNRYNIIGFALYHDNHFIPYSTSVEPYLEYSADYAYQSIVADSSFGNYFKTGGKNIYQYIMPCRKEAIAKEALVLYSDASYISKIVRRISLGNFFRLFIQILLVVVLIGLLIRWGVYRQINSIVNWVKAIRDGSLEKLRETSPAGFLEPLQREVTNIAFAMQEARAVAEEEARLRTEGEAIWTPDRLREEIRKVLPGKTLVVVSNREPYMHIHAGKEIKCIVPASGMVTAVEPILQACGGLWIASGTGDADKETVDKQNKIAVPPNEETYILKRVWISKEEETHFYYGFSNEGLWPLCHIAHNRPVFRKKDWDYYKRVNGKFARAVLEEIKGQEQPFVLVQDYHFALLPELIKRERPDATIAIFWHIPWPNPESFSICPWQSEILRGMLGSDLIGFHTPYFCYNFLETVNNSIDSRVIRENMSVRIKDRTTLVKPFPISISFTMKDYDKKGEDIIPASDILAKYDIKASVMGIGVERIDYTKGIIERFHAVERFLEKYPDYQGRFTFVQIAAPSRTLIKSYSDIVEAVKNEASRINLEFKAKDWKPILLLAHHHSHEEIMPFYKSANFCMVTSLHDGMNLVAKEFVAARNNNNGVLILSRFTGASHELSGAIIINPYDTEQMADAIKTAIEMPAKGQQTRMKQMRQSIMEHNIYSWAANLIKTMVSLQR